MITYIFALDFIYVRRISLAQCFINYEFHSLIFTLNLSRLTFVTIRAALWKTSRALPLRSYRSRGAESPFSRSDGKGSHRTPAWKLIILRFEKLDLVQQNDFAHRILGYLTYICVLYSHENNISSIGRVFRSPLRSEEENGGPSASGRHLGWPHFRFPQMRSSKMATGSGRAAIFLHPPQ